MEIREYQNKAYVAIQPHTDEKDEKINWLIGLTEEVGELANLFKHEFYGGEKMPITEFAKEAGDVLWYLSALCTSMNVNLEAVAELNVNKLHHRFALGEFDREASVNRHQLEEKFSETEAYITSIAKLLLKEETK